MIILYWIFARLGAAVICKILSMTGDALLSIEKVGENNSRLNNDFKEKLGMSNLVTE